MPWSATEVIGLVTALAALIASLTTSVASLIVAIKTGAKVDGMLVARDASNVSKGERIGEQAGRTTAQALAEGQRQGLEQALQMMPPRVMAADSKPLPVVDEEAAAIAERIAGATEASAEAQKTIAAAALKR